MLDLLDRGVGAIVALEGVVLLLVILLNWRLGHLQRRHVEQAAARLERAEALLYPHVDDLDVAVGSLNELTAHLNSCVYCRAGAECPERGRLNFAMARAVRRAGTSGIRVQEALGGRLR